MEQRVRAIMRLFSWDSPVEWGKSEKMEAPSHLTDDDLAKFYRDRYSEAKQRALHEFRKLFATAGSPSKGVEDAPPTSVGKRTHEDADGTAAEADPRLTVDQLREVAATVIQEGQGELVSFVVRTATEFAIPGLDGAIVAQFQAAPDPVKRAMLDYLKRVGSPHVYPVLAEWVRQARSPSAPKALRSFRADIQQVASALKDRHPATRWINAQMRGREGEPDGHFPTPDEFWVVVRELPLYQHVRFAVEKWLASATDDDRSALMHMLLETVEGAALSGRRAKSSLDGPGLRAALLLLEFDSLPSQFVEQTVRGFHRLSAAERENAWSHLSDATAIRIVRLSLEPHQNCEDSTIALLSTRRELCGPLSSDLLGLLRRNDETSLKVLPLLTDPAIVAQHGAEISWWLTYWLSDPDNRYRRQVAADVLLRRGLQLTVPLLLLNDTAFDTLLEKNAEQRESRLLPLLQDSLKHGIPATPRMVDRLQRLWKHLARNSAERLPHALEVFADAWVQLLRSDAELADRLLAVLGPSRDELPVFVNRLKSSWHETHESLLRFFRLLETDPAVFRAHVMEGIRAWTRWGDAVAEGVLHHAAARPPEIEELGSMVPHELVHALKRTAVRLLQLPPEELEEKDEILEGVLAALETLAKKLENDKAHPDLLPAYGEELRDLLKPLTASLSADVPVQRHSSDNASAVLQSLSHPNEVLRQWAQLRAEQWSQIAAAKSTFRRRRNQLAKEIALWIETMSLHLRGRPSGILGGVLTEVFSVLSRLGLVPIETVGEEVIFRPVRHRGPQGTPEGSRVTVLAPGLCTVDGEVIRPAVCDVSPVGHPLHEDRNRH